MQLPLQRLFLLSFLVGALILGGCDSPPKQQSQAPSSTPPASTTTTPDSTSSQFPGLPRLNGLATVEMKVKGKTLTIEVDGKNAPISAGNFVDLVQRGFYNGLTFHRVVRSPQPFVVQGGDPRGNGTGGFVPPGSSSERRIPLEITPQNGNTPIYSQEISEVPKLQHKRGAIAMARSMSPDSASSQFYFTLADLPFLDGKYAVFGRITQGVDVIDSIQQGDRIESARVTQGLQNLKK
jgi:peptidyl-prolyl cis-trans isomerase B (cyclophilin B)